MKNTSAADRTSLALDDFRIVRNNLNGGSRKGATYFGIGAALARIVRAILRDENAVLTVSSLVPEFMALGQLSLSLPAIINRNGIAKVLSIPLSAAERSALEASARVMKEQIALLGGSISTINRTTGSCQM